MIGALCRISFPHGLLLSLLLLWGVQAQKVTTAQDPIHGRREEILKLQEALLVHTPAYAYEQERSILYAGLESSLQKQADWIRLRFRNIARPNDRKDNPNISNDELQPGMPLWYLMEIPQWWVTAKVDHVIDEQEGHLVARLTYNGQWHEVLRGVDVRTVTQEDMDAKIWESEYERDLGEFARIQNDHDKRLQHYEKAISLDKNNPHPVDNFAIYYTDQGDAELAKVWCEKSLEIQPNWYHTYYNYGLLLRDHPDPGSVSDRDVLELFETAWNLNPLFLDSLWNLADQYHRRQLYDLECYGWRLLLVLNRNPSPQPSVRSFGMWNPAWEDDLPKRIELCMKSLEDIFSENNGEQSTNDEL